MFSANIRRRLGHWEYALVFAVVVVFVYGGLTSPVFLTPANLSFAALNIGEVALISVPLTLIIVMGEIDISVASVLGLSAALMGRLWDSNVSMELILPIVLVTGLVCGLVNGVLVTWLGLPSLAVTIGTFALYRGLAQGILGTDVITGFPPAYTRFASTIEGTQVPYMTVLWLLLAVFFGILLHATPFGRGVFAIGANEHAAFYSGINVRRTKLLLFSATGLVSSLAGVLFSFHYAGAQADTGLGLELTVISAVVLGGVSIFGGKGTMGGVILAVILLGGIQSLLSLDYIAQDGQQVVTGILLLVSVLAPVVVPRARSWHGPPEVVAESAEPT